MLMQAYAKLRTDTPELLDLVAQFAGQDLTDDPMAVDGSSTAPVANSGELAFTWQYLHSSIGKVLVGVGKGGCSRGPQACCQVLHWLHTVIHSRHPVGQSNAGIIRQRLL